MSETFLELATFAREPDPEVPSEYKSGKRKGEPCMRSVRTGKARPMTDGEREAHHPERKYDLLDVPARRILEKAKECAGEVSERMRDVNAHNARAIIAKAEEVSKDKFLGAKGFKEFARLLGVTVMGTKPNMLKRFREAIDRMAVTYGQTQF